MLAAAAGMVLLWAVALVSIRLARRRLRYEFWWAVHLYSYLGLALALMHQLSSGAAFGPEAWQQTVVGAVLDETARAPVAEAVRLTWVGAFVLTMSSVLWYRVAVPALRSRRYALRVASVDPVEGGAVQVSLSGRRLQALRLDGGQFANFRFGRRGLRWQAHPYSFSGLPHRSRLYLTVGGGGDHARAVAGLAPGTRVFFEGPYGTLTARAALADREAARGVMILVGGLGVTPICSLLRDLPAQSRPAVIYRVRREGEALFVGELRRLASERMGSLTVLAGSRELYPISAAQIESWVPDASRRHVYVCGSRGFVDSAQRAVLDLGVPRERVTTEAFTW
jgi:predicted ferric reductase